MKHLIFFSSFLLLAACTSTPKTEADTQTAPTTVAPAENAPSGVELLQGVWQSTEDPKAQISISNSVYDDIYDGKKMSTGEFSFSADCSDAACKEGKGTNGCFSVEDQKSQMTCFSIVKLTADDLDCSLVGGRGNTNHYKKVK